MARYNIIMKDETYFRLMQICKKERKSMGKKINEILNRAVRQEGEKDQDSLNPHCMTCNNFYQKTGWCVAKQQNVGPMGTCENYHRG